ncbi:hypothetical protein M9H77_12989 [Catharanthus roseus]|uniref:Uncharacterized protein n=1 Tax=Catharanthus roseus TaxID=4058 RepID=A0ACC0BJ08_CATRO|nr:hypothetical protein M9H77_12989 [Catharanthus roseus]
MQQVIEGLEQQISCLAKDVGDLKRDEEAIFEQSSIRNLGGHSTHNNQWGYGNFSPYDRSYEHNSYDCYGNKRKSSKNEVRNGGNYVKTDERFHKKRGNVERYYDNYDHYEHSYCIKNMYNEYNDSFNHGRYSCGRSSQTLRTILCALSYNNLKLPFLWAFFILMLMKHGREKWNLCSIPMM